jgi:hypothetical protein
MFSQSFCKKQKLQPKRIGLPETERTVGASNAAVAAYRKAIRQTRPMVTSFLAFAIAQTKRPRGDCREF